MEKRKEIKNSIQELKVYTIQKFILILFLFIITERLMDMLFTQIVFPALNIFFEKNQMHLQYEGNGMFFGVIIYLIVVVVECFIEIMPKIISVPVSILFQDAMMDIFHINSNIFSITDQPSGQMSFFLRFAFLALVLALLVIAVFPYIVSTVIFSLVISQKAQEQEKQLEKQRNLLLADIAHDLKTPLTTVTGYSQALLEGVEEDEEKKKEYLENIYRKSLKINEMVRMLFEYLKLESEGFSLKRQDEDICEIVRENVALQFMDFEQKNISLDIQIPETPLTAYVDKLQLSRAVSNLLSNMLKHNQSGRQVSVIVAKHDFIEIHVADNGVQIPDSIAKNIFEPFAMGDESRASKNGSGLGLSIASKIVKMHGGRLELNRHSTENFTKDFVIYL